MKPKILIFSDWYLPAFKAGGPVKSVSNLVDALSSDFDFDILTSDRDFGDLIPFPDISKDSWIEIRSGVRVQYFSTGNYFQLIKTLISDNTYAAIYLNSLFSVRYSFLPLIVSRFYNRAVVLAPRGMLGKGALSIKRMKKQIFISFYRFLNLDKFVRWQATSVEEWKEIVSVFDQVRVNVVPNIPTGHFSEQRHIVKQKGHLKICFISRISEKKNLLFGLEILRDFEKILTSEMNLEFNIFGPIEDSAYWQKCLDLINSLSNRQLKINYSGELKPEEVPVILNQHHFLFLPTRNENFGHIIYESFSTGVPVVISDQTPWRNLKERNIGFDFSLSDRDKISDSLKECLEMDDKRYNTMVFSISDFLKSMDLREEAIRKSQQLFSGTGK